MNLQKAYSLRKKEIKARLKQFKQVKGKETKVSDLQQAARDDIFYELCFCLLTPQSNAKSCDRAVGLLRDQDFLNRKVNPLKYLKSNTRFHNNKSRYLLEMKENYSSIELKRDFLVKNVKGLGLKEASHFLRNIGYKNLAILDRHILKNLVKYGAISELPKSLTPAKYFEIEDKFKEFSSKVGIPMDELDLLFWSMETGEVFK